MQLRFTLVGALSLQRGNGSAACRGKNNALHPQRDAPQNNNKRAEPKVGGGASQRIQKAR